MMKILILTKPGFEPAAQIATFLRKEEHAVAKITEKVTVEILDKLGGFDLGISVHYKHILDKDTIDSFKYGVMNIHPGYLPYGRGADPIIWSMVNDWPLGITIHWIDEGIDTGNILYQIEIERFPLETGEQLYNRMVGYYEYVFGIFWSVFDRFLQKDKLVSGTKQDLKESSLHKPRKRSDLLKLGNLTDSRELKIMLALSHSQHNNMYTFDEFGNKYWVKLTLERADDTK